MKVPVEVVREMKRTFTGPDEMWRMGGRVDGWDVKLVEVRRMWRGKFTGVRLEAVEWFFWMLGYKLTLAKNV